MTDAGAMGEAAATPDLAASTAPADLLSKFDGLVAERQMVLDAGMRDPVGVVMTAVHSPTEATINGVRTILVGTYNYMGMTFDADVIAAGEAALRDFGAGTTGSRVLNGTYASHKDCEAALCEFYGTRYAMVFSTGYQANLGIVSTLAGRGDYVILDADSHASIYDGCNLGNADIVRFRHNSVEDLAKRLGRLPAQAGKLVILEGVYSMLGDIAPLAEMVQVAKAAGAMILVDEAHAMGFFGDHGRGVTEAAGVAADVDFIIGTFSKSVGTVGGFCVSDHPKFEALRLVCRPYVFTAALPPTVMASSAASIRKLMHNHHKREQLWDNTRAMHDGLRARGFTLGTPHAQSAIIAVMMPDQVTTVRMWQALLERGVYVNFARPPATPMGTFLLRCSLCAEHRPEQIAAILAAFGAAAAEVGLPLTLAA